MLLNQLPRVSMLFNCLGCRQLEQDFSTTISLFFFWQYLISNDNLTKKKSKTGKTKMMTCLPGIKCYKTVFISAIRQNFRPVKFFGNSAKFATCEIFNDSFISTHMNMSCKHFAEFNEFSEILKYLQKRN